MHFDLSQARSILKRTPALLTGLLAGLPEPWTSGDEGPGTWSPYAVVHHLVHGEHEDWLPRLRTVLEHGAERTFEPFDRFAPAREAVEPTLADLLEDFTRLRRRNLADLDALHLCEADLDRQGSHPGFGPVTLGQLLATWTAHDLTHLAQITRTMARQCAPHIGPWRAYFRDLAGDP